MFPTDDEPGIASLFASALKPTADDLRETAERDAAKKFASDLFNPAPTESE